MEECDYRHLRRKAQLKHMYHFMRDGKRYVSYDFYYDLDGTFHGSYTEDKIIPIAEQERNQIWKAEFIIRELVHGEEIKILRLRFHDGTSADYYVANEMMPFTQDTEIDPSTIGFYESDCKMTAKPMKTELPE